MESQISVNSVENNVTGGLKSFFEPFARIIKDIKEPVPSPEEDSYSDPKVSIELKDFFKTIGGKIN
jgi:hypothetical protein